MSKLPGAACDSCPLQHCGRAVPGSVPKSPSGFALISDFPGQTEVAKGAPYVGQAGKELDKGAERVGLGKPEVWRPGAFISNVIACKPPRRLLPKEYKAAYDACAPRLALEIEAWRARLSGPAAVGIAGKQALRALTGKTAIESWCGGVWEGPLHQPGLEGVTAIPLFNPAQVLYDPKYRGTWRIHLSRVVAASRGVLRWSWPEIIVGRRDGFDAVRAGLGRLLERTSAGHLLGYDVETAGIRISDALVDFGLSSSDPTGLEAADLAVSFDWRHAPEDVRELARRALLMSPARVLQHGKFDALVSVTHGVVELASLRGSGPTGEHPWDDTMHAHQIVAPLQRHKLGFIASTELPHPKWKDEFKATGEELWKSDVRALERAVYNAKDAWVTARIWGVGLRQRLAARPAAVAAYGRLLDETLLAYRMQKTGLAVDLEARERHAAPYRARIAEKTRAVRRAARAAGFRGPFKPTSGPKMRAVFELLGVEATNKTATGLPQFDAVELTRIALRGGPAGALAQADLDRREYHKLFTTYVRDLHAYIDPDGRMRCSWTPGLVSGRWSASDPGIHQMPKVLRDMFVAGPGRVLVGFDLGQIEPRCLAVLSEDPAYIAACASGRLYETLAAKMFGRASIADVTPGERQMAKRTNLAVSYGAGVEKLEASLKPDFPSFTKDQAARLKADFFKAFPGIKRFQAKTVASIARDGALIDPDTGLLYPQPEGPDAAVAANQPIQVAATWTMRQIVQAIDANLGPDDAVVIFLHDELVIECPEARADLVAQLCHDVATSPRKLRGRTIVPVADVRVGKAWGGMKPWVASKAA